MNPFSFANSKKWICQRKKCIILNKSKFNGIIKKVKGDTNVKIKVFFKRK